jgi:hypothetical protein
MCSWLIALCFSVKDSKKKRRRTASPASLQSLMTALDQSEQNIEQDSDRRKTVSPGGLRSLLNDVSAEKTSKRDSDRRKTISPGALQSLLADVEEDVQADDVEQTALRRSPRHKNQQGTDPLY